MPGAKLAASGAAGFQSSRYSPNQSLSSAARGTTTVASRARSITSPSRCASSNTWWASPCRSRSVMIAGRSSNRSSASAPWSAAQRSPARAAAAQRAVSPGGASCQAENSAANASAVPVRSRCACSHSCSDGSASVADSGPGSVGSAIVSAGVAVPAEAEDVAASLVCVASTLVVSAVAATGRCRPGQSIAAAMTVMPMAMSAAAAAASPPPLRVAGARRSGSEPNTSRAAASTSRRSTCFCSRLQAPSSARSAMRFMSRGIPCESA